MCLNILRQDSLYHLHDLAGWQIANMFNYEQLIDTLAKEKLPNTNYILLKSNHTLSKVLFDGTFTDLDSSSIQDLIQIIRNKNYPGKTRQYFLEAVYALTTNQNTADTIHQQLSRLLKLKKEKEYNDSLYAVFNKQKVVYNSLKSVRPRRNIEIKQDSIYSMFENAHPIMFLQILAFSPPILKRSENLSKAKHKALLKAIEVADESSFYSEYKLMYLSQLTIKHNENIRYLESFMNNEEIQALKRSLQKKRDPHLMKISFTNSY